MRHSPKNLKYHELIGLKVRIVSHSDPTLVGLEGIIVDETRSTLLIDCGGRRKRVLKLYGIFEFTLPNGKRVSLDGSEILGRPEDRLKRVKDL
ncbi:MAG: ribonuclease P protein subunit [Crenarchaeota archaeon]|nr:ribonuclease P protein subunit [Thermoproteota archaeon]